MSEILAVIPARFASTRLPGKPLLSATGKPLIRHVVEAARRARCLDRVIVATDDPRIYQVVTGFGGEAAMTRADHPSGTDRVAEVASAIPSASIVVNVQGDEPEIAPEAIQAVVEMLQNHPELNMATIATPIRDETVYRDPGCVKVVLDGNGRALYFSRSPIPMHRDGPPDSGVWGLLHLGLYAYRREFLLNLAQLPVSPLERAEKLEQLRVLGAGAAIGVATIDEPSVGIDTPEDYERFVRRWNASAA